jgi:hypothetical protein
MAQDRDYKPGSGKAHDADDPDHKPGAQPQPKHEPSPPPPKGQPQPPDPPPHRPQGQSQSQLKGGPSQKQQIVDYFKSQGKNPDDPIWEIPGGLKLTLKDLTG